MTVSYNWLKDYLNIDLAPEKVSEILTSIGLEVEGFETRENIKGGLKGLVIGHVLEREKHPNADRLSVTKVDVGRGEPLSIVCGAPNVAAGQKVVVATEGTVLYPTNGESFTIKKGKIRGEDSEGMICAEDEIGLGDSHDGIMILPQDTPVGMPASEYFKVETDTIFEIGLTPNRSDATNHIGVAFDLAAYLKVNESGQFSLKEPVMASLPAFNLPRLVEVIVEDKERSPRYSGVVIKGVKVKESPEWLKNRLLSIGVRAINNVVDITNYVLHEMGQPLHAFDLRSVGTQIRVKTLAAKTKFVTLDGLERELHEEDLMICNGDSVPMCIAGVFGGAESGVSEETTDIFLESAHFHPKSVRRTSSRHLLRTDAATRFEKGTDPNVTIKALLRAAHLIQELAGGVMASNIEDFKAQDFPCPQIEVRFERVNRVIGNDLSKEVIKGILAALDFNKVSETENAITVNIPTNKADVLREADVIEEILRIYGFDKVALPTHIQSALAYSAKPDTHKLKNLCSEFLTSQGFFESMALSLTQSKYAESIDNLVYINNTANTHLDIMRPTMLFGMLEAVNHNQNRQNPDLKLYEFGKTYFKNGAEYLEERHLSIAITGKMTGESWLSKEKADAGFYHLKTYVQNLFKRIGISSFQTVALGDHSNYNFGLSLTRGKMVLAEFGSVKKGVLKQFDVKQEVFFADILWDNVAKCLADNKVQYKELSKFPMVRRDLALVLDKTHQYEAISNAAFKCATTKGVLKDVNLFDVYENETQLGEGKKSYALSFIFGDDTQTLNDKAIEGMMAELVNTFVGKFGAVVRGQ